MSNIIDGSAAWKVHDLSGADKVSKDEYKQRVPFKFGVNNDGDYGYYKGQVFIPFDLGQGEQPVHDVISPRSVVNGNTITLTWGDPNDIIENNVVCGAWSGTKVLRSSSHVPTNIEDGTVVCNNTVRNQYSSVGYQDTGLTVGTTYYYRFFPYTESGIVTTSYSITVVAGTKITTTPSQTGTLTYDGTAQTASWDNFSSDQLSVTGNTATNAGTYTAVFTPKAGYMWNDGTIAARNVDWVIGKATGSATLSTNSVTLTNSQSSATVTVTGATGTVTVSTSNSDIATASYTNGTITISGVDGNNGSAVITVTVAENTNYTGVTYEINVSTDYLAIVTWAGGTDAEIAAMVEAADAGSIDLTEYWHVGDIRTVSLSAMSATGVGEAHVAQTVYYVLVAADSGVEDNTNACYNYQYVTATSGRSYPSFIVQQKDSLANGTSGEFGYMNSVNTNNGSWGSCMRKAWCDDVYRTAISSSTLRGIFKQVKVKTIATYNGTTMQESNCYFFLPAAAEVFKGDIYYGKGGTAGKRTAYSNLTEFNALSRWAYYATSANRIKYQGSSGSAYSWWERSPYYNGPQYFCIVLSNGNIGSDDVFNANGIAPSACI